MFSLKDKIALVTGAGSGIGASIARVFAKAGAHVIVADIQESAASETAREILSSGGHAQPCVVDVADEAEAEKIVSSVHQEHGRLDILVNNAGIGHVGTILQTKVEDLDRLY